MKKTYIPKAQEIDKKWYLVDADGKTLGRLAAKVAVILRGKHKALFTPHMDTGDGVIIINAAKIKVTGRKLKEKVYRRYSGYPGGLREVTLSQMLKNSPTTVLKLAISRMLPGGRLGKKIIGKLKVYPDQQHSHKAQNPTVLEV